MIKLRWSCLPLLAWTSLLGFSTVTADEKVRLQTDWYPQPEHGGFYNALVRGYYKAVGLDAEIVPGGPNTLPEQRVATGAVEFAMTDSARVIVSESTGIDLYAAGATMQQDPQGLMLHPDDPAQKFEDLEGRSISVASGATWFQYFVKKYNFKKIKEVPVTFTVANFLRDNRYIQQIFVTSEPYFVQKANPSLKPRVLLIQNTGYTPYRVYVTTKRYLKAHPETVKKFVSASIRGWKDYLADPSAAHAEIAKRNPEMDAQRMMFSYQALKDGNFVTGEDSSGAQIGRFDPARWQQMYEILKTLGLVTKEVDLKGIFSSDAGPS